MAYEIEYTKCWVRHTIFCRGVRIPRCEHAGADQVRTWACALLGAENGEAHPQTLFVSSHGNRIMIWNYRVFREDEGSLSVREVFYERDGNILACSNEPVKIEGDSIETLTLQMVWFKEAMALPVLTLADLPQKTLSRHKLSEQGKNISHEQLLAKLGLEPARNPST